MRSLRFALLPLAFAACSEQSTVASLDQTPAFNFSNAPAESGIIMRGERPAAYTWVDVDSGLRLIIGADINEFCSGIINFDLVAFQDAYLPEGRPILEILQGEDMQTTVWDFLPFDCVLFTSVDPAASGVADLVNTDNDLFGNAGDRNANAWTFTAQGTLTLASGADAQLSAHLVQSFTGNGRYNVSSKISLK